MRLPPTAMPKPQDGEQSAIKQKKRTCGWLLSRKHQASSTDVTNAQPKLTTTNVPPTNLPPLPVSAEQPSTVPRSTGIGHNSPPLNKTSGTPIQDTLNPASIQANSLPSVASTSYSPRTDGTASRTTSKLPSQVEETLAACPRFRILLVGNTGVGKSSLVSYVFNIVFNVSLPNAEVGTTIDIAHDRAGVAVISHEYYSDQNPRFILHDSMGFEPGDIEKSEIVKSFLRDRAAGSAKLPDQVHAIWLCIETPRKGSRLLQTGDENLLRLAKDLKIPVIVVLTKYDLLVMEHYRACSHKLSVADKKVEATKRAMHAFNEVTKELRDLKVAHAPVSTRNEALKEYGEMMLVELTQVTQNNLLDEKGSLMALWATAQQINARQKFELSISEGFKNKTDPYYLAAYWRDLGDSVSFHGYRLVDCIARIHDDVLKIWNFNDPSEVLCGEEFFKGMMELVESLSDGIIRHQRADDTAANVASIDGGDDSPVLRALGTIIEIEEFQFLRKKYQKGVSTAIYFAAYIVDLTLVLHQISTLVTANPPKSLSWDFVKKAQAIYRSRSPLIHAQVKEVAFSLNLLEEKIASVIQSEVGSSSVRTIT